MAPDWTAGLGAGSRRIKRYPPDPDQAGLNAKGLRPCRATFFPQINSRACTAIRHYIVGFPIMHPLHNCHHIPPFFTPSLLSLPSPFLNLSITHHFDSVSDSLDSAATSQCTASNNKLHTCWRLGEIESLMNLLLHHSYSIRHIWRELTLWWTQFHAWVFQPSLHSAKLRISLQ